LGAPYKRAVSGARNKLANATPSTRYANVTRSPLAGPGETGAQGNVAKTELL
jgi:hypothetical protein